MSALPSPLKSPNHTSCHSAPTTPHEPYALTASPFISHAATSALISPHMRSALPLPLPQHSSLATTTSEAQFFDGCAAAVLVSPAAVVAPSTTQMRYVRTLLLGKPINVSEVPGESGTVGKVVPVP